MAKLINIFLAKNTSTQRAKWKKEECHIDQPRSIVFKANEFLFFFVSQLIIFNKILKQKKSDFVDWNYINAFIDSHAVWSGWKGLSKFWSERKPLEIRYDGSSLLSSRNIVSSKIFILPPAAPEALRIL